MAAPTDRRRRAPRVLPEDREARRTAIVSALLVLAVAAAAWAGAPALVRQDAWQNVAADHDPRTIIPLVALLFLAGASAPALFPRTWEGELASRGLRALGWSAGLYWLVGVALEAPEAAALFAAPALLSMPFSAVGLARRVPHRTPVVGVALATIGLIVLLSVFVFVTPGPLFWLPTVPAALLYAASVPTALRRTRRETPATASTLDLPPETLHPAAGTLGLVVAIATVAIVVVLVAPGVPLSAAVAWSALALGIPAAARSLVRRGGIAHPRGLVGRPDMRIHEAAVHHLPDVTLERLDAAIESFLRHGFGRRRLARALSALLEPTLPHATPDHLATLLRRLPRGPWLRARRERALASLLGGERILAEAEARRP